MSRETQCTNEKALEFYTLCTSSKVEVGSTRNNRVPIDIIKASGLRRQAKRRCLGWTNHRANRLVDLATLTFCFCEASAIAQGRRVECVALFWLHRSTGSLRRKRI